MLQEAVEDAYESPTWQSFSGNQTSHEESGAMVTPPWAPAWPVSSQQALTAVPSRQHHSFTMQEYPSVVFSGRVEKPIQPGLWLPQYDGAGDQSSEELSLFGQNGLSRLLTVEDDADSQQLVAGQLQVFQQRHPHMVFMFLAKMRALVVRRRHQHGAVADSLALDGWRRRMWQRAVLARFARSENSTWLLQSLLPGPAHTCVCFVDSTWATF